MNREPVELPAVLDPLFVGCANGNSGLAFVEVFEEESYIGKAELEWLAKSDDAWTIQVLSPLGQTLVRLARKDHQLSMSGRLARRLPPLMVREDGFLEVDGHLLALKAEEVPCLLSLQLPRSWLPQLVEANVAENRAKLMFEDDVREIQVRVRGLKREQRRDQVCATFQWSQYLGLVRSEATWCVRRVEETWRASLKGLGEYSLEWVRLDN